MPQSRDQHLGGLSAQRDRMIHDNSTTNMGGRTYMLDTEEVLSQESRVVHANDDFDDVFGSAPGSPSFFPRDDAGDGNTVEERLDERGGNAEWSDIPRLKEKHETEGYRDGVTKGKADSVQKGFDEGYGLGATLGLKIGKILGVLEGVYGAVRSAAAVNKEDKEWEAEKQRLEKVFADAKTELKTQSVFGKEYWGEDGIWRFEVPGEKEVGKEVLFPDVAAAHPLVVKWEGILGEEVERWGLDLDLMEHSHAEEEIETGARTKDELPLSMGPGAAKELSW